MLEKITQFFHGINNAITGNNKDRLFYAACCDVRNSPHYFSAANEHMWRALESCKRVPQGQGIVPPEPFFSLQPSARAQAIENLARIMTRPVGNIFPPAFPAKELSRPGYTTQILYGIDRAVSSVIQQFLPWQPAAAQENHLPEAKLHSFQLSQDDSALFEQKIDEFIRQINLPLDNREVQQLKTRLQQTEAIFVYHADSRKPRAHVDEVKRNMMIQDLVLKDQRLSVDSLGTRLISWGENERQNSYAFFVKGVESGNVAYLLQSGFTAILAELLETTGEVVSGEIFERQPGESSGDRFLRLANNFINPPEMAAANAFRFQPSLAIRPLRRLPGTVITHPQSGITFQSVLQTKISGLRWQLFPQGELTGVAVPGGRPPVLSREATLNPQTNKWRIDGMPDEYHFTHPPTPQVLVKSSDGYYPVKASRDDGTLILPDGQKIWFNQRIQQWMPFYVGNRHLHARCLNVLPEQAMTLEPGRQGVLRTAMGSERRIWQTQQGKYYLEVRAAADVPGKEINYYLEGWPEGDLFTIKGSDNAPLHQLSVLRWQPRGQRWDVAPSPFNPLKQAEARVDSAWLQQEAGPESLTPVNNRPGLYHLDHQFLLRWRGAATGEMHYLPLLPSEHPDVYIPEQADADDLRFHYDEHHQQWRFLPLTYHAFRGIPEHLKLTPENAFPASYRVPGFQSLYRSGGEFYIHIGSDNQGVAEYIQVEQDNHNRDRFSLTDAGDDGSESHWQFRYDHDNQEFETQLCQRAKRADDEPCAGPSGQNALEPNWFIWHQQRPGESNVDYARRLYTTQGNHPDERAIERHTGIDAAIFRKIPILPKPQHIRAEDQQWLDQYPRRFREDSITYGTRLHSLREEQLADGKDVTISKIIINLYARVTEGEILHNIKVDTIYWLKSHPRLEQELLVPGETNAIWQEKNMAYAGRLLKARYQPPKAMLVSIRDIAIHAQLTNDILLYKMHIERRGWLESMARLPDEHIIGDEDLQTLQVKNQHYARRITELRDRAELNWLISDKDIADHARVTLLTLRQMQQGEVSGSKLRMPPPDEELQILPDTRLLSRQWEDWRPLLVDANDLSHSLTKQLITPPVKAEPGRNQPRGVKRERWRQIKQQFTVQAQALIDSDGQSMQAFSIENLEVVMDEQRPEVGVQIRAKRDIPAWTFLGGYSGVWHAGEVSLQSEFRKMGSERVLTYLWASKRRGAVSGLRNANKLALINTGSIKGISPLGEDNVAVGYINDLLPYYYTLRDIKAGEQLLIDYGAFYNPKYDIQTALNNDVISIAARTENKYIVVRSLGDNVASIYSPYGRVEQLPKGADVCTLQERTDDANIIRYDVISKRGKRRIKIDNSDGNHLYYALARAMDESGGQDIIKETVDRLKAAVAAAHPEDDIIIKSEPASS